ncbi:MAG: aspartate aminotransferase family protein, partial [Planctomycetota bacterium]
LGDRLAAGLGAAATKHGIAHQVQHVGSMLTLFFNEAPVSDWPGADRSDREAFGRYFWGLIERGVYMPCSQFEALFFSCKHTEAMIDETIDAADAVLAGIAS